MRDFIDAIFSFIGASSLTDLEFSALTILSAGYDAQTFEALILILDGRAMVSPFQKRLAFYFQAKGVQIGEVVRAKSNIYIGSVL